MKITKFRVNGEEALVSESALEGQLLPPPSAEDVGKTVVVTENGKYTLAEAGGGSSGGAFIVHVDDETSTLDKTWAEINAAIAKQPVILLFDHSDGISHYRKVCYIVQTFSVVDRTNTYYVYAIEYEFGVSDVSITKRSYQTTNENGYPRG